MTYSKRLALTLGMAVITIFVFQGVWAEKKVSNVKHITLGVAQIYNTNTLPMELGTQKGIYKKEGIDIEMLMMRGFVTMAALNNDQLDYVLSGGTGIRSVAAGMRAKAIMVLKSKSGMSLVARSGINSVKDLKGRVIGVSTLAGVLDYAAKAMVRHGGLDPDKDVTIRPVGVGALTYLALRSGTVDAGVMNVLHVVRLLHEEKKGFKELMEVDEAMKGVSNNILVSDKKLKENPLEIKRVIRGILVSLAYLMENRKEAIDLMVKDWGLERDFASLLYDREKDGYNEDGKASDEAFQAEIENGQKMGQLPPGLKIPTSKLRDFTLLEEVLKETGIK